MSTVCILLLTLLKAQAIKKPDRKTVVITGANRGIGLSAARILAESNEWNIIFACRSIERGQQAIKTITKGSENIQLYQLDLSDLNSVKSFVNQWGSKPIDCLALNAGISVSNKSPSYSAQGYESTIATNHIGHFYLMNLLLSNVHKSKNGRIVIVGSNVHNADGKGGSIRSKAALGNFDGLKNGFKKPYSMIDGKDFNPDKAYKDSKLCNIMTCLELARRLERSSSKTICCCMSPGLVPTTGLFREYNPFYIFIFNILMTYVLKIAVSEEVSGQRLAYLINCPSTDIINGAYYSGKPYSSEFSPIQPSNEAKDEKKAALLWKLTEDLINNER